MKNTVLLSFVIALAGSLSASSVYAAQKIGMVDMERALQTVDAGKSAKTQLEREFNAKKKELDAEKSAIDKAAADFKKKSLVMSDTARNKKQSEIQERVMRFQEAAARSENDIQKKQQELTAPILSKLRGVIAEIAKQKGYTTILEKNENLVLFSDDTDDLTNDVIAAYNKKSSG